MMRKGFLYILVAAVISSWGCQKAGETLEPADEKLEPADEKLQSKDEAPRPMSGQLASVNRKLDEINQRLDELADGQQRILDQLKRSRGAADVPRRPQRVRPDPVAVYSVPIKGAPYVGARHAKVTIVKGFEFA